jgi:hypothetical protein
MRKVIVSEFVTLDGVMEDPGGAEGFGTTPCGRAPRTSSRPGT